MLQVLFFIILVRPMITIFLGVHVTAREKLPLNGPAIIVANHNSHLDTLILMSLFPLIILKQVRPVAAADYFLKNRFMRWFSLNIIRIIPLKRKERGHRDEIFKDIYKALDCGETLILFPEGSRGEPEIRQRFKNGVAHLVEKYPNVPVIPVMAHGLGNTLPKGEWLPVPFFCDVAVGDKIIWQGERVEFMKKVEDSMLNLQQQIEGELL